MSLNYKVVGTKSPVVLVEVEPGQKIYGEPGRFWIKSSNVQMRMSAKGGFTGVLKRKYAGESALLQEFYASGGKGMVGFALDLAGDVKVFDIAEFQGLKAQRGSFIAAEGSVEIEAEFAGSLKTMFFGGEGLVVQSFYGEGDVIIGTFGDIVELELDEGEKYQVDTGALVAWEPSVKYSAEIQRNVVSALFGGEGLFLATIEGPGRVWLQTTEAEKFFGRVGVGAKQPSEGDSIGNIGGLIEGFLRK